LQLQHPDLLEFSEIDMEMVELTLGIPSVAPNYIPS
jgi:hypothetical protein